MRPCRNTTDATERVRRINQLHQDGFLSRVRAEWMLHNIGAVSSGHMLDNIRRNTR